MKNLQKQKTITTFNGTASTFQQIDFNFFKNQLKGTFLKRETTTKTKENFSFPQAVADGHREKRKQENMRKRKSKPKHKQ